MAQTPRHVPVLLPEIVGILDPRPGETVLDVTLGLGGHARAFLESTAPDGRLIAFDADAENLAIARGNLAAFSGRVELRHRNFGSIGEDPPKADVAFADLGLSSPHVDDPSRGFTFRVEAPLDLRYDRSKGDTAAAFLARAPVDDVSKILRIYGEVPKARSLAEALVRRFSGVGPAGTTKDAADTAIEVYGYRASSVLPQIFQALRIAVNDELSALGTLLETLPRILPAGGRAGIISYHSLEDRMVKLFFRSLCEVPKDPTTGRDLRAPSWELLTPKAIVPGEGETASNPRSRSAKFRAIRRTAFSD